MTRTTVRATLAWNAVILAMAAASITAIAAPALGATNINFDERAAKADDII